MTITYGPFLLSHVPLSGNETEAEKLALLEQFANIDMAVCSKFREVIDGKVVEFRDNPVAMLPDISHEWIEGSDAEVVLNVKGQQGWVPASYFQFLDGYGNLFVPYGNVAEYHELTLPSGQKFDFLCVSGSVVIDWIKQRSEGLRKQAQESPEWAKTCCEPDTLDTILEFHDQLIESIEACMKAEVIFMIGY